MSEIIQIMMPHPEKEIVPEKMGIPNARSEEINENVKLAMRKYFNAENEVPNSVLKSTDHAHMVITVINNSELRSVEELVSTLIALILWVSK